MMEIGIIFSKKIFSKKKKNSKILKKLNWPFNNKMYYKMVGLFFHRLLYGIHIHTCNSCFFHESFKSSIEIDCYTTSSLAPMV